MKEIQEMRMIDTTANPAPLGLLGFGMTTILLNLANAGVIPLTSVIMGMGLLVGGLAQLFVGMMEWKKNNTFGTVAFTSYGAFWMCLVAIWTLPKMGLSEPADAISMGYFLTLWGIYTVFMFIGTLRISKALQFVFGSLVLLFFLLAIADFTGSVAIKHFAAWEGIICGLSALYTSFAQVLNEVYGKVVMPLGPVKK